MIQSDVLVNDLLKKIKGEYAAEGEMAANAMRAYEMGAAYAQTRRFDNSRFYHNYKYQLDDGSTVLSSNFFNLFTNRHQTAAYMDAEAAVKEFIEDKDDKLFHLVRDQRFGINGVFKAVMSPSEPQQLNYIDYVVVIACFCAGVMNK